MSISRGRAEVGEGELELIRRSLNGEIEAWGEIVRRYKEAVFGVAMGILGNAADAEDISHDAFIRAYENLRRYDLSRRFSTWLFAITANLCKNKLRRERFFAPLRHASRIAAASNPAEQVAKEELSTKVRESLNELSFKYRAPLVLRFYADLDYKEIAQALDLPEGTVKTRLHRGKLELKRILEQKGVKGYA